MVYATCSYAPEENEAIVSNVLKRFGGAVEVLPIQLELDMMTSGRLSWAGKSFHDSLVHARRILPGYHTDGFFICKLYKHSSTVPKND